MSDLQPPPSIPQGVASGVPEPSIAAVGMPRFTQARAALVQTVEVTNERGERETLQIPAERPLTVYVDRRELVTLMTLGAQPELLVLGYLRNQRLVDSVFEVESITVDWEVNAAAVVTRAGISQLAQRTARKVVTTGCGQGSVFGGLMDAVDCIRLPESSIITQAQLYALVNTMRLHESTYKSAGSVHGCALFLGDALQVFVEDVGRHNAIDTIAGWMWTQDSSRMDGADKVFYTTGRLTSEMVIKAAQMGIAVVVSRSGMTQMGLELAQQLGLCAIGRATHRRFVCYSAPHRVRWQPELVAPSVAAL